MKIIAVGFFVALLVAVRAEGGAAPAAAAGNTSNENQTTTIYDVTTKDFKVTCSSAPGTCWIDELHLPKMNVFYFSGEYEQNIFKPSYWKASDADDSYMMGSGCHHGFFSRQPHCRMTCDQQCTCHTGKLYVLAEDPNHGMFMEDGGTCDVVASAMRTRSQHSERT